MDKKAFGKFISLAENGLRRTQSTNSYNTTTSNCGSKLKLIGIHSYVILPTVTDIGFQIERVVFS